MTFRSIAQARWFAHANAVAPSPEMRDWLTDRTSLTRKLVARSEHFRVRRLHQGPGLCLADECALLALPRRTRVQQREVLLQCDGRPVVYAHTVVPLSATASDWPFFSSLGERSLGTTLFGDPLVVRGALQFARLRAAHPLVRRVRATLGAESFTGALHARRCLFKRRGGLLLVTEIFLPSISGIGARNSASDPVRNVVESEQSEQYAADNVVTLGIAVPARQMKPLTEQFQLAK